MRTCVRVCACVRVCTWVHVCACLPEREEAREREYAGGWFCNLAFFPLGTRNKKVGFDDGCCEDVIHLFGASIDLPVKHRQSTFPSKLSGWDRNRCNRGQQLGGGSFFSSVNSQLDFFSFPSTEASANVFLF